MKEPRKFYKRKNNNKTESNRTECTFTTRLLSLFDEENSIFVSTLSITIIFESIKDRKIICILRVYLFLDHIKH